MTDTRPVDLAAPQLPTSRWCVTYPCDDAGHWHEAYFRERPAADAYASAHRGSVTVRLANLDPWPTGPT